jgi:hypothetical protein
MSDERPERPPAVPRRVSSQALDVLLKLEAEQMLALLPERLGLPLAPLLRFLPTELPVLDLHLERLDTVGELTDRSIVHLEFEAVLSADDVARFLGYGLALARVYPGREIQGVVFCGARTPSVPAPIDLHPVRYRLTFVRLTDKHADTVLAQLRTLVAAGTPWADADRLDLVLLPLMRRERSLEAVIRDGLALARTQPPDWQPRAMGFLLAQAYHYEGQDLLNRLVEELMSTNLLDQILSEKLDKRFAEGIERGIEQGVAKGRLEGEREMLRRYLTRRFDTIPPALDRRIAAAGSDELTTMFDQAVSATTMDEML